MTNIPTEADLLDRIRAFLARHDMAPTRFGREASGEAQLITSIERGRSPSLKVVHKIITYMAEQDAKLAPAVVGNLEQENAGETTSYAEGADSHGPFATVDGGTGSSPTSSSTTEPPAPPAASPSSRSSSDAKAA
jgi:hypothetical protein